VSKQDPAKVVDVPLDFAEWGSGLRIASTADASPRTRDKVEAAFAAADAEAAKRLAGPAAAIAVARDIQSLLEQAGLSARKVQSLAEHIASLVSEPIREYNARMVEFERSFTKLDRLPHIAHAEPEANHHIWVVEPRGSQGWAIRSSGKTKAYRLFRTRREAEQAAIAHARAADAENGKIFIEVDVGGDGSGKHAAAAPRRRRTAR
jgi:hypothetical protein